MLNAIRHFTPFNKSFFLPFFYFPPIPPLSIVLSLTLSGMCPPPSISLSVVWGAAAVLSAHLKLPSFFYKLHTAKWIR